MKTFLLKHIHHYYLYYIYTFIFFIIGFFTALLMKAFHLPIYVFPFFELDQIVTLNTILAFMYKMILIIIIMNLISLHQFGLFFISLLVFLYGLHNGFYFIVLCNQFQNLFQFLSDLFLIFCLNLGIIILSSGLLEVSLNLFVVSFLFKEVIKPTELFAQLLNYSFISSLILFIVIILKIYLLKL